MQHIEEHILELYLLGDEKALQRRGEIEAHLSECHGCRAMADRIKSFYATAEEELAKQPEAQLKPGKSLVRKRADISPFYEVDAGPILQRPTTRLQQFQYFVRRHPVAAGVGSFSFLAGLALLANTVLLNPKKDENPVRLQYLHKEQSLLLFNSSSEILRTIPTQGISPIVEWNTLAQLIDLDNDGRNELVTTLRFLEDDSQSHSVLRILDYKNRLVHKKDFSQEFTYLNRTYSPDFGAGSILTGTYTKAQSPEVFVIANNPRSPCYIARLDAQGTTVGEYWHFGQLFGLSFIDINGAGQQQVVAWGENDTEDSTGGEFPVIVVLDPNKIVDKGKSPLSPGFAMSLSNAELCYIRLPQNDVNKTLHTHSSVSQLQKESDGTLWFTLWDNKYGGGFSFEFVFSSTLQLLHVKSTTSTDETHSALVEQGKLTGTLDAAYLQNLKDGVRYWSGREWSRVRTPVTKPTLLSQASPRSSR